MSGEKENMVDPEVINSLAGSSVIIRDVLGYRDKLLSISIDDVLSEDHSVEALEGLADQYLRIGAQLRVFRQDCGRRGMQIELDIVDEILTELKNEIAIHISMIRELIWAKRSTTGAPDGRRPPEDQFTRELKQELAALKREEEREEKDLLVEGKGV